MQTTNEASGAQAVLNGGEGIAAPVSAPAKEYSHRLAAREAKGRRLHKKHIWLGNARVVVGLGFVVLCWVIGKAGAPSAYWLAGLVLVFIGLGVWHGRTLRSRDSARRAANFYRRGLARIEDRWMGSGETGEEFQVLDHLYADDLDILGDSSLFQLLCTARTRMGKACLAAWLLAPATPEEVRERQPAVQELTARLDLREDLAVLGESDQINADGEKLDRWLQQDAVLNYRRWWIGTLLLAMLSVSALVYGFVEFWTPFAITVVINSIITFSLRNRLAQIFGGLDEASKNLDVLAHLLRRMENEKCDAPRLRALQDALTARNLQASECIAKLGKLSVLADSRSNMILRVLDVPLLYSVQMGFALQRWKDRYSPGIARWLDSIGQIEALVALGTYKFEHPEDPFPEFAAAEKPCFQGVALGHPLLAAASSVRNDLTLGGRNQVLLVSGSNMSGKSTLLRVAGVNAVLAMMGAPVRARSLRLSPVALGAAMRLSDSLQKGVSHFYAEISRIRQVVELSSRTSTLFLFDEILQGTNSHDRRIGAEGVLRALIRNGAIGLVTTHDLALTSLTEVFPDRVRNVHFQEKLDSGKLYFDYLLRDGVVTTSNGIELMKSIGLEV